MSYLFGRTVVCKRQFHGKTHWDRVELVHVLVHVFFSSDQFLCPHSFVFTPLLFIFKPPNCAIVFFICLFVCCYKTKKFLLCLPPWARSKTFGISTRASCFFFVCFFADIKSENPHFASRRGLEVNILRFGIFFSSVQFIPIYFEGHRVLQAC